MSVSSNSNQAASSDTPLPPIRLAVRTKAGIEFRTGFKPDSSSSTIDQCSETALVYSPNGAFVAVTTPTQVQILSTQTLKPVHTLHQSNVAIVVWSPLSSHVLTFSRKAVVHDRQSAADRQFAAKSDSAENLHVYCLSDSSRPSLSLHCKQDFSSAQTAPIQWAHDELIATHCVQNELRVYAGTQLHLGVQQRVHCDRLVSASFAPSINAEYATDETKHRHRLVAVVIAAKHADPARVHVLALDSFSKPVANQQSTAIDASPIASKSFYKAEDVVIKWSFSSSALLIEASTSSDATGQSYYGESSLHLLHIDASLFSGTVSFGGREGPIQDFAWHPARHEFLVIQGKQPATATLFNGASANATKEYAVGPYNTIRYAPHGRWLVVGGFGNLAGEMIFFDTFKFRRISQGIVQDRNGAKSYEWTPDSRHFVTSVLRPWRRVDNGIKGQSTRTINQSAMACFVVISGDC